MKRVFLTALALFATQTALATKHPQPVPPAPQSSANAVSAALAGALSNSEATAQQQQTASAASEGSSASSDNALNLTQNYKAVRNAPSVAIGSVYPTAGCQGGIGLGGSGVNGSGLLNFSFTKKECETVVLAQNFASIGMPDVSCKLLKTTKAFKRAGLADIDCTPAPKEVIAQVPVDDPPVDPRYVTRDELNERDRRLISKMSSK